MSNKPILRPLDFQPVIYEDQQMWLLRDPLQLTEYQLVMPAPLAQMLLFCDGSRTPEQIHSAFCQHINSHIDLEIVTDALKQLDTACLLDNDRSRNVHQGLLNAYRDQPNRPAHLANLGYPSDPQQLADLLQNYSNGDDLTGWGEWRGRGIISPHIDYQRGGPVYAKVWQRAKTAVLEADLTLIFGTDHNGSPGSITLTRQPYATPYGVLPNDTVLIDTIATAIGPKAVFAEELHHRTEHSVELSAVWLHHIYQQAGTPPKPMIPILCGSFHHFVIDDSHPANDELLSAAIETLRQETKSKKVLAVASVDLAHVGPNFGDNFFMNDDRRLALKQSDGRLIQSILRGDADDFYAQITAVEDRNRICGFSSIYLMLRFLGKTSGVEIAYDHCPADPQDKSLVSICGLLLD